MALQLKTAAQFLGRSDMLARPPLPDDALGYADFLTGLHITQTADSLADTAGIVMNPAAKRQDYVYGRTGEIELAASATWQGVEYDANGDALGLAVSGGYTTTILAEHRTNLSAGAAVGATVAAAGTAAQPWQQWYSVTPAGAGEASLTLGTGAMNGHGYLVFDARGTGFVQVGFKAAPGIWANFDLATGAVVANGTSFGQAIPRPGGSWSLGVHGALGSVADAQPYIASVASLASGALGAAGAAFDARAPRATVVSGGFANAYPWPTPMPGTSRTSDNLPPATALVPPVNDFSVVFSARSGSTITRVSETLIYLLPASGQGVELRFTSANKLVLYTGSVLWTGETEWKPDRTYNVGFSRRGGLLAWSVNGETGEADVPAAADWAPQLLRSRNAREWWWGHLRRVIWWADGRPASTLRGMADRWL